MFAELPPLASNLLIGTFAVALCLLFWRNTSGLGGVGAFVTRAVLILLLMPFVIAAVLGTFHKTEERPGNASAPPPTSAPAPVSPPVAMPAPRPAPVPQSPPATPPVAAAPPPVTTAPPPVTTAPPPVTTAPPASPAPPAQRAPPPAVEQAPASPAVRDILEKMTQPPAGSAPSGDEQRRSVMPASPAPAPAAANDRWDVVPVYFGTDRKPSGTAERLEYGNDRGRKLELGGALVTVPKAHEVPNVERPWVYRLPFTQIVLMREQEDPAKHFTLKELKTLSRAELAQVVRERLSASRDFKDHAFVFVHGFNTTFEAALFRTAQMAYDLGYDGAPFLYSWPSKGQIGFQDYSYDRESSGQAEPYLKQFLEFVTRETGAKSVSIIAHSMGNQLLLPVLRELKRTAPDSVSIDQIILAAPDVDRDTFEFLAKEISGVGKGITMLAAGLDLGPHFGYPRNRPRGQTPGRPETCVPLPMRGSFIWKGPAFTGRR